MKFIDNPPPMDFHDRMFSCFNRHRMVDPREGIFRWKDRTARAVTYYTAAQGFCFDIESVEGGVCPHQHSKRRQKVGTSEELWMAAVQQLRMIWGMGPKDEFAPEDPPAPRGTTAPPRQPAPRPRWVPARG